MIHNYTFKRFIEKLCLTLIFSVFAIVQGLCTTYYVSGKAGNDSNAGTSMSSAWKTIKKANSTLRPGDVVYIRGGVYKETIRPGRSGTAGNYITYAAYDGEEVVLIDVQYGANLSNRSYIKVDGFKILDVHSSWVYFKPSGTHNIVQNCYMEGAGEYQGIRLTDGANYNQILNNVMKAVCNGTSPSNASGGPSDLITCFNSSYNLFEGNEFYGGIHNGLNIQERGSATGHHVVRNNYFECRWHGAIDLFHDPEFILVEGNLIVDTGEDNEENYCGTVKDRETIPRENKRGIKAGTQRSIIRNNILINNGHAISNRGNEGSDTNPQDNRVYNNTMNDNYQGGWISDESGGVAKNNIWKNNIMYNNKDVEIRISLINSASVGNAVINNNVKGGSIRRSSKSGLTWKDNLELNPKFVSESKRNLKLASGSPMIDAGTFLTKTTSSGDGKVIKLEDVYYFFDGWNIADGDVIQLEGQTTTAKIVKVDYSNKSITVNKSLTWIKGQGIGLAHNGLLPDIGAYEYSGNNGTSTPTAPSGLTATGISSTQIKLQWSDRSGNEAGFVIERSVGGDGNFVQIATVKSNITSYTNDNLSSGTTYFYRVRAKNVAGTSSASNKVSSKTGSGQKEEQKALYPEADTYVHATYGSQNYGKTEILQVRELGGKDWQKESFLRFNLSQESGKIKSAKLIMYVIESTDPVNHRVSFISNDSWSETEVTWNNRPSAESGYLAQQKVTTTGKIEFDITDKVKAELGKKISLKLYAAENVAPYIVYGSREHSVVSQRPVLQIVYGETTTEPSPAPSEGPAAPTNVQAKEISGPKVEVTWNDASNNEDKFIVERAVGSGSFSKIATLSANTERYVDGNVSGGKTYFYRIKVINSADRDWSSKVKVSVDGSGSDAPSPGGKVVAPTELQVKELSGPKVEFTWVDISSAEEKYIVERAVGTSGSFSKIASLSANTEKYVDSNVSSGKTYMYRIKVVGSTDRDWSNKKTISLDGSGSDAPAASLAVTRFILYNAETDKPISGYQDVTSDVTVDFSKIGTKKVNIVAITNPSTIGSVWFKINGSSERVEGTAPYALKGDSNGDYNAWSPGTGSKKITAIPYSKGSKNGEQGEALTVTFKFVDGAARTTEELAKAVKKKELEEVTAGPLFAEEVNVFPNPAKSILNIYSAEKGKAFLYDINGKHMGEVTLDEEGAVMVWDISDLQSGIYFLKIMSGTGISTKKIVVEP